MLKHFFAYFFLFSFILVACGDDSMPPPDQQPPPPPKDEQEAPMAPDVVEISDDELESFVQANIRAGREQIDPQTDTEGFQDIVEEEGLEVERYMEIHATLQQDPQLQQEVQELFQELE
ncbi:MAG: DUF4168 domain-containing protein [Cyclonatronaceae bacterium]